MNHYTMLFEYGKCTRDFWGHFYLYFNYVFYVKRHSSPLFCFGRDLQTLIIRIEKMLELFRKCWTRATIGNLLQFGGSTNSYLSYNLYNEGTFQLSIYSINSTNRNAQRLQQLKSFSSIYPQTPGTRSPEFLCFFLARMKNE